MDIQYFRTFKIILATGSYSAAATELNYTQSTITAQMKRLASVIGEPPFLFRGKTLRLSPAGKRLVPLADAILASYQQVTDLATPHQLSGSLRLSVPESLMLYGLNPILQSFATHNPLVNLTINNATCVQNRKLLLSDQADVALMLWPLFKPDPQLSVIDLGEQRCSLVAARDAPTTLEAILAQPQAHFVINEKQCGYRRAFEQYRRQQYSETHIQTMEVWSLAAIKQTVSAGLGFSFLPDFVIQDELANGLLKRLTPNIPTKLHIQLLFRKNWHPATVEQMVQTIKSQLPTAIPATDID